MWVVLSTLKIQFLSTCFYKIPNGSAVMEFTNISAINGGWNIYGAPLTELRIHSLLILVHSVKKVLSILNTPYSNSSLSLVSSEPKRVCLCENNKPMCANLSYIFTNNLNITPGEKFNLRIALVGYDFGTTIGPVYASLFPKSKGKHSQDSVLGQNQNVQRIGDIACNTLEYTIYSNVSVIQILKWY